MVRPTIRERAEAAAPLVMLAVAFSVFASVLHGEPVESRVGAFALWLLFAALAVVAATGALASMLFAEGEPAAPRTEPRPPAPTNPREAAIPSPPRRPMTMPPARPWAARTLDLPRVPAAPWEELASDREEDPAPSMARLADFRTARRAPIRSETTDVTPEAALDEIDGVWRDLQKLRHFRRRRMPG